MTIVYQPLKTALHSLYERAPEPTAAVAVWLAGEDSSEDALNFIYCCDTRAERLRLAALLLDARDVLLRATDEDFQPQIGL